MVPSWQTVPPSPLPLDTSLPATHHPIVPQLVPWILCLSVSLRTVNLSYKISLGTKTDGKIMLQMCIIIFFFSIKKKINGQKKRAMDGRTIEFEWGTTRELCRIYETEIRTRDTLLDILVLDHMMPHNAIYHLQSLDTRRPYKGHRYIYDFATCQ